LGPSGWDNSLTLIKHILRAGGGRAFLEVHTGQAEAATSWIEYGPVDWNRLEQQLDSHGLAIEESKNEPALATSGISAVGASAGGTSAVGTSAVGTSSVQLTVKEGK
jgi:hypothetical protein